ncbi:hypothetical protein F4554_005511 [Actinopolymorpha rutila]|uniref:Uncharacterized protein n=1 Tax=Actinopolymorpha rutila TaxID=446787 RepID=A0A852ZKY3_9ACTN|nr:hypothetical protein [Actinopolymorpha rutila]
MVELLGPDGSIVAREGDYIVAGGALAGLRATKPMPCIPPDAMLTHIQSEITAQSGPSH